MRALKVCINNSAIVLQSLDDAVRFIRSQPFGDLADMLIEQMEAARRPDLERHAWRAFETFARAMRLCVQPVTPQAA